MMAWLKGLCEVFLIVIQIVLCLPCSGGGLAAKVEIFEFSFHNLPAAGVQPPPSLVAFWLIEMIMLNGLKVYVNFEYVIIANRAFGFWWVGPADRLSE